MTDPLVKNTTSTSSANSSSGVNSLDDPIHPGGSTYAIIDVPVVDDGGLGGYTTYDATLTTNMVLPMFPISWLMAGFSTIAIHPIIISLP